MNIVLCNIYIISTLQGQVEGPTEDSEQLATLKEQFCTLEAQYNEVLEKLSSLTTQYETVMEKLSAVSAEYAEVQVISLY